MSRILKLLNHYNKENIYKTHLSFTGGKWYIENLEDFYYEFYKFRVEEYHIIEHVKYKNFKLFFDIEIPKNKELDFLEIKNFNLQNLNEFFNIIKNSLMELFTIDKLEFLISERKISQNLSKFHINTNIVVNENIAIYVIKYICNKLQENDMNNMIQCIDKSVYSTGLRIFGSKKPIDSVKKEIEYLKSVNLYNETVYEETYKLIKEIDSLYTRIDKNDLNINDFMKLLVLNIKNEKMTKLKDLHKKNIKETESKKAETDKFKREYKTENEIKENVKTSIKEIIEKLKCTKFNLGYLDEINKELDIQKINCGENNFNVNYFITINNKYCPFKEREHIRFSNPVYIELNNNGLCFKCFDSECMNKIYPETYIRYEHLIDVNDKKHYEFMNSITLNYRNTNLSNELILELNKCVNDQTHYTIAKLIYYLWGDTSKYGSTLFRINQINKPDWYEFDGIRYKMSEKIEMYISEKLVEYFEGILIKESTSKYIDLIDFLKENEEENKHNKNIKKLIKNLKDNVYKRNIKSQLANILFNREPHFYEKLNTNPYLLGFDDGIYDLKTHEFRNGKPDDFVTYSTKYKFNTNLDDINVVDVVDDVDDIDFDNFENNIPEIKEIFEFLYKLISDKEVLRYLLLIFGRSLEGFTDEKFYIFTGTGANGKSTLINLYQITLGDYNHSPDVTLFTQDRKQGPSPEKVAIRNKRALTLQEPDNDTLRVGVLKQLTGGDIMECRNLFEKTPLQFKSQASIFLCCNDLPNIKSLDGGTWRRIRVIKFKNKFVVDTPKNENEYQIDNSIKTDNKLEKWRPYFMKILIHFYKEYKKNGISEPEQVLIATKKYEQNENRFHNYIKNRVQKTTSDKFILKEDIVNDFNKYWVENNVNVKFIPKSKDFINVLSKTFNIEEDYDLIGNVGFYGIAIKEPEFEF
jgi:P4 family phage/plasmid primase-like protien